MLKKLNVPVLVLALGAVGPAASAAASAAEDLTIVFKVTGPGEDRGATQYFTPTRVRFDQGDEATVVNFADGRVLNISMKKKQYSETTFAEIEQAMTTVSAEMEKAMAGIPEGLRNKMMGDASKEVTVTKGETRTIAGVACQNYTVALSEKTRMETCVAASLVPPFDPKNFKNLTLVSAPIGRGNSGISKMVQKLREIEGVSLASSTSLSMMGKKIETATEATEVRKGPIDASVFDVPPGFKKVDSPFAKMAR